MRLKVQVTDDKKCVKVRLMISLQDLHLSLQCCDDVPAEDQVLQSSRVQQELRERGVRLETFLPPSLVMEKYRELRERGGDNTTLSVNLSREELLMLVHQASKTEEKSN